MEAISYESNEYLPGIVLDKQSGIFKIYGQSCPENAIEFYDPIFNWFDQYLENPSEITTLDFKMTYFNTVSAKVFFLLMTKMEDLSCLGHDVKIRWYYPDGDETVEEAGEEFANLLDLKFESIPVEDEIGDSEIIDFDSYLNDSI